MLKIGGHLQFWWPSGLVACVWNALVESPRVFFVVVVVVFGGSFCFEPNDYADRSLNPTTANTQPGFTEGYKIMQQY